MRREWFLSIGATVPAFLAGQHHNLMLLLVTLGLGGTEMSFMTAGPLIRRAMLLLSLAMVAVIGYQLRDAKRPRSMRITGAISIIITVGLAIWSVSRSGL